jgi:hypothetical protein
MKIGSANQWPYACSEGYGTSENREGKGTMAAERIFLQKERNGCSETYMDLKDFNTETLWAADKVARAVQFGFGFCGLILSHSVASFSITMLLRCVHHVVNS